MIWETPVPDVPFRAPALPNGPRLLIQETHTTKGEEESTSLPNITLETLKPSAFRKTKPAYINTGREKRKMNNNNSSVRCKRAAG